MNPIDFIQENEVFENKIIDFYSKNLLETPNDPSLLMHLGNALRKAGKLRDAGKIYKQAMENHPDNKEAIRLYQIFSGRYIFFDDFFVNPFPSAFFQIPDFLDSSEIEDIWEIINKNLEVFEPSSVTKSSKENFINNLTRKSKVLYQNNFSSFAEIFLTKIYNILPGISPKLQQLAPIKMANTELQLTMHLDGDFFKTHRDSNPDVSGLDSRKITFVYYFHTIPKKFEGGNLLLFDTSPDGKSYDNTNYTKITPDRNKIIFFPSHCFHKVTPIKLLSEDFRDGRFTLNGWLHA